MTEEPTNEEEFTSEEPSSAEEPIPAEGAFATFEDSTSEDDLEEGEYEEYEEYEDEEDNSNRNRILLIIGIAVLAVVAVIICFLLYRTFLAPAPEPPPTIEPTPTEFSDEAWRRIQENGKIVVGLSSDYPPFEFLNQDLELDGFDVELARDIGNQIGVKTEFQDIAFNGLGAALQVGQIDVAISAVSVTEERQASFDFSNIYFVSEDAFLEKKGSNITLNNLDDVARFRVGVQTASVFEDWLQSELVDTGKMPESNLISYQDMRQATRDLADGFIDLVLLDLDPAELAATTGEFTIVRQGLNPQRFAIGVAKGNSRLLVELNKALTELQNNGRLNELSNKWLGRDAGEILPIPTPEGPTPTPEPEACVDAMVFLNDLTYPSGDMNNLSQLAPGERFRKGWQVGNTGSCVWDSSYTLEYVGGNTPASRMGGQTQSLQGTVNSGGIYDWWVDLVAPLEPGTYIAFWSMRSGKTNEFFGSRLTVAIEVPAAPTATPKPTQTPTAEIQFSADPTEVNEGDCSTLTWVTQNVKEVYLYPQGSNWQDNQVPGSGTRDVCPPRTTTYELRVVNLDDSVETRQVTVFVIPNENAPEITRFTVDPSQIQPGACVQLQWVVEGQVDSITITRNTETIRENAPQQGSMEDCPPGFGSVVYTLAASGPGGTSQQQQFITIVEPTIAPTTPPPPGETPTPEPPTATPEATPTPPPPTINIFAVEPNQIQTGECVQVSWDVGGTVDLIQILRNGSVVLDDAPFHGSEQDCLTEAGNYSYQIVASNNQGQQDSAESTVNVSEAQPENPLEGTAWELLEIYDGENLQPVIPDTELTAEFKDNGILDGTGGCNNYSGSYFVEGDRINIENLTASRLACGEPEGLMQQEASYFQLLEQAEKFRLNEAEETLELTVRQDDDDVVILKFEALPVATPF